MTDLALQRPFLEETTKELNPVHKDECNVLIYKYNFRELHRSQHECIHTFKAVHEFTEFFWTHLQSKTESNDINMDVIHTKIRREGLRIGQEQVLKVSYRTAYGWKTRAEILCQEISTDKGLSFSKSNGYYNTDY